MNDDVFSLDPLTTPADGACEAPERAEHGEKIRVSVAGASGYSGVELVRLLLAHPHVEIVHLAAGQQAGSRVVDLFPNLRSLVEEDREFVGTDWHRLGTDSDVVFLALPHGLALEAAPILLAAGCRVIDLGADFRLQDAELYQRHYGLEHTASDLLEFAVYGLPELNREAIRSARLVANPGCYPTATTLACLPLLELLGEEAGAGVTGTIVVDAKSGVSGAGRKVGPGTHFSEVDENFKAYGVLEHRHQPEMEQVFSGVLSRQTSMAFVPQLVPMTRGILSCCYLHCAPESVLAQRIEDGGDELCELYRRRYCDEPFVRWLEPPTLPQTKATTGGNWCDVSVRTDAARGLVVALGAIDNLMKGAAGQAVQNFNLMLGFEETCGLLGAGVFP